MQHDSPPDSRVLAQPHAAAVWMDTISQSTDTAMDTSTSTASLTHVPGSSVLTSHSSPLRSVPSSVPHTPMQSSVQSPIFPIAKAKRVSDGTSSSLTSSSAHTSPAQAPTSAASVTSAAPSSTDSGSAPRPPDRPQSRARKSQSRSSVKKPRSKKPKRDEMEDAVADSDLYTVLQLDRSTSLLCFLVTEQQRKERLADAESSATPGNKHKFTYIRSKQSMHGYVCVREVEAKMLRNLPQYRSRDSQSFRSSIRQAFEKLHYWPLEATRPEVLVLKQNDFLKMNAPNTCVYPINHIINFLAIEDDPAGNLERWSKQLEQRWAVWMDNNGYELSTDSSAESSSGTVSDAGLPPPKLKPKPKPRARKQSNPRRAARVEREGEEEADEEREETEEDENMDKVQSNPRGSPSSLAARRNVQPAPLQQHSSPQALLEAAHTSYPRQHQGFGSSIHAEHAHYTHHDSGSYGHHAQPTQHHQHNAQAHYEHGSQSHAPYAPLYASASAHRRQGSSAMGDHHSHARPTPPTSSRALQFVPSSHQFSHPAPFSFHQPPAAAAAAASGYQHGSAGPHDPFGHAQGQYMQQPLRPLIPVVQIRQPITLVLSPTSLASASDLRHSPDLMSPVSPSLPHGYLPLSKGRTSPSDFLLKSPVSDALQQPPPMLATSQHHQLQVPNRPRTGSELPAGFSAVHEPWSGRSATENFLPAALVSPSLQSAFGSPGLTGSHPMHTVTTTTTTTTYAHQQQHHPMHMQSPQPHGQQQMTQQQQQLMQQHYPHRHHAFHPPSHAGGLSHHAPPPAHQDLSPMPPLPPSLRAPPAATSFGAAVVQMAESIPPPAALNQRRRSLSVPAMLVEMANMRVAQEGEATQAHNK